MADFELTFSGPMSTRVTERDVKATLRDDPLLQQELDRLSTRVQLRARQLVGVSTGTLFSTIRKQPGVDDGLPYVDVTAGHRNLTPYFWWHHEGTPPHVITPRRRKALRFVSGGRVVFATRVQHPGTVGTKFLTRALDELG